MNPIVWIIDRTVHVELKRNLRMTEAAWLREELFPYLEQGYCLFSFNFTEVESIDSSGIGILLALQKKAKALGGGISIHGIQEEVRARFEFFSLSQDKDTNN
ncbi:STAS domain-containing protein [Paenibacillus sp. RC67]|uniref:STAS domain-containing protein n=1 Tax=Paenibacillus sp. RC67 TaxID=3039392 RepID=UPI0024ACB3A1|nr:STAS domain-containing protein [Paenibacillus sp. RC67]